MNPIMPGPRDTAAFGFERFSAATVRLSLFPDTIDSKSLGGLVTQLREKKASAKPPARPCDCGERAPRSPRHRCRVDYRRRDAGGGTAGSRCTSNPRRVQNCQDPGAGIWAAPLDDLFALDSQAPGMPPRPLSGRFGQSRPGLSRQ
jgi:hypothetical protein